MLPRLLLILLMLWSGPAFAERRVALVLASEEYRHLRVLANPVHDALAVEDMLRGLGFDVTVETDRDLKRMRRALRDFEEDGAGADVALVFYAGHGVEVDGLNYLLPVDAEAGSSEAIKASSLPLSEVQETLARVAPVAIVLLDACREDPFGEGASGEGRSAAALDDAPKETPRPGLGRIGRADGVLFAFSAAPGEVAADGDGADSPFTEALLRHFATPGIEVRTALTLVQQDVYDRSRGKQLPYVESGLPKLFFAAMAGDLQERDRLLIAMAGLSPELRAEVEALAKQKDMPLAPLYGALLSANLEGKDAGARAQALVESAESFLRFRDQVKNLSPDDPKVSELRVRAEKALELGSFDEARATLQEAIKLDSTARDTLRENYRARTLSEAQTHALAAQAARADLRYDLAMGDLSRAIALYAELEGPDLAKADRQAFTDLYWDQGDLFRLVGNSTFALRSYQAWEQVAAARMAEDPQDGDWSRNWAVAETNIGDMLFSRGDLDGAGAAYQAALPVVLDLAARPGAQLKWRHDVFVTQSKLGDVAQIRGNFAEALRLQEAAQAVVRALVVDFPERDDVRGDLAIALDRIGDLRRFSGDLTGAEHAYNEGLEIRKALLAAQPETDTWKSQMSTSFDKVGDLLMLQGNPEAALDRFTAQIALLTELTEKDPGNSQWQRDLSVGLVKMGDATAILAPSEAGDYFRQALAIRQRLVATDPGNADWQRDLAIAHVRLGDLAFKAKDFAAAAPEFQAGLAISRQLVAADPMNSDSRQELGAALDRIGDLAMMQGDVAGAEAAIEESYASTKALADMAPDNAEYQIGLVASLVRLAIFAPTPNDRLNEALAILHNLQAQGRLDPAKAGWIGIIEAQLVPDAP